MAAPNLVEVNTLPSATSMDAPQKMSRSRLNRPRWQPKVWHPVYEEIVLLDALGYSNIEIAKDKGFTVVHISNILCTPQAKMIKRLIIGQVEKQRTLSIDQRLEKYSEVAMRRVEETLDNDVYAQKNPGGMFDRALKLLTVTNRVKDPDKGPVNNTTLVVPSEVFSRFTEAMERSREERKLLAAEVSGESFTTVKA